VKEPHFSDQSESEILSEVDNTIGAKPYVIVHAGDLFDTVKPKTRAGRICFDQLSENYICANATRMIFIFSLAKSGFLHGCKRDAQFLMING
jgi:DNA repair exonuclease SbcCD nuclease subunit